MSSPLADSVRHPKIYAWTDEDHAKTEWEGKRDGVGLIKVGYTDRDDVDRRIRESRGVSSPLKKPYDLLLREDGLTDSGEVFKDHVVHEQLVRAGVHRLRDAQGAKTEWFECSVQEVQAAIDAVRSNKQVQRLDTRASFEMRSEQLEAVQQTAAYLRSQVDGEEPAHFLWNAKMRFGKTFTAYQLAREMGWTRVLVLTYKPAVESAWREDLEGHVDFDGWLFKGKDDPVPDLDADHPIVWFASFQDVLGTDEDGKPKERNEDLYLEQWDAVVIDEYHFGAWREAARGLYLPNPDDSGLTGDTSERAAQHTPDQDDTFNRTELESELHLEVDNYLYLSGTPFRALTQGEFLEEQVFNWTYADEQRAKSQWDSAEPNPYRALPRMRLLAYEMPDQLREVALNNSSEFSLTQFFATTRDADKVPHFDQEGEVQKWLDLLRGQDINGLWSNISSKAPPLPFEDTNLLRALQHTIWYLPSIDACEAMANLFSASHNTFFNDYEVIVAAGRSAGMGANALPPVEDAIGKAPQGTKTITLTCGKLLTGVTVPAWAGILMLRELKSPESYFQAAFRVQSPWRSDVVDPEEGDTELIHKHECYVIDFSPNRALSLIVEYATGLSEGLASSTDQEAAVAEFIEFLPVLSFDGFGMRNLEAGDVIDLLTTGVSATMLARRWNSTELVTLDVAAMQRVLADEDLLASLEKIEAFRTIRDDLTAMISTHKELKQKKLAGEKLDKDEKKRKKKSDRRRKDVREKLRHFLARLPAFMYLTDQRERAIKHVIEQNETGLFERVTGLTLHHFKQLVDLGVFENRKMDDAVWKFRQFEEPSLSYGDQPDGEEVRGGFNVSRSERLATLIDAGVLAPGDELTGASGDVATLSDDYGMEMAGIRYVTPDAAAAEVTDGPVNGWEFWSADSAYGAGTLQELAEMLEVPAA